MNVGEERWELEPLVNEIRSGNCVAFVGAGFSAAVVGGWKDLLQRLAKGSTCEAHVESLLSTDRPESRDFEIAAQLLEDTLGREFSVRLARAVRSRDSETIRRRAEVLLGIPFHSVLTTNFDDSLAPGTLPGADTYRGVLRGNATPWRQASEHPSPPIVQLHGQISPTPKDIIFAGRAYRHRLYSDPAYLAFLRATFATRTVLFLGFSFTDAYLNAVRSEVLELLKPRPGHAPFAYALFSNAQAHAAAVEYARLHEHMAIFTYAADTAHTGFDRFLSELHRRTSPSALLARVLAGKHIVWVDRTPSNNAREIARICEGGGATVTPRASPEALTDTDFQTAHLMISHWGGDAAVALQVVDRMRARGGKVPLIVYAGENGHVERRRAAINHGVHAYCFLPEQLFSEIERVLADNPYAER